MADENAQNQDAPETPAEAVETTPEEVISAFAKDDELLDAAFPDDDGESDAPDTDATPATPEADADAGGDDGEAERRGLEVLITERGMTAAQAKRLLAADPEMVRQFGADALEADRATEQPEGETTPEGDAKGDEPEDGDEGQDAPAFDRETLTKQVAEALGETFDKDEAAAISRAIGLVLGAKGSIKGGSEAPDLSALVEKAIGDKLGKIDALEQAAKRADAVASDMYARRVAATMADTHPELKTEDGYRKMYAKAESMVARGIRFGSMEELLESAALAAFGATRKAEIDHHKERINRARGNGAPTQPKDRAPSGGTMSRDDLALSMALEGATQQEVMDELARTGR